jgi:hypothetical protein
MGRAQPWVVHHRELEFHGEVIVAETIDPTWRMPLEGDVAFRVVFCTVPRRLGPARIQDPRTAMAVPRSAPDQARHALSRELGSIHEARALYATGRDAETLAARRPIEEREVIVRGELARLMATSYSQGRIYAQEGIRLRPQDIFGEDDLDSWADALASAILLQASPELPFDHHDFPATLTSDTVGALFEGLFQGNPDAAALVRAYGPGLGLTRADAPDVFDAGASRAIELVRAELESRGWEMPARDVLEFLVRGQGLTRPLALLYLMACVRNRFIELTLTRGHNVTDVRGSPFLGDRITWDLVSEISFSENLDHDLALVGAPSSPTWDTALPYTTLILKDAESGRKAGVAQQEARLLDTLEHMAGEIRRTVETVRQLEARLGGGLSGALEALTSLQRVCVVANYREFLSEARTASHDPSGLEAALDLYRRIGRLVESGPEIVQIKHYLDGMSFGPDHQDMSLQRQALVVRIDPEDLLFNPALWDAVEADFRRLRDRYVVAYTAHHARYHEDALELSNRLEESHPQVAALTRFNDMPELGRPLGEEVPALFEEVRSSLRTCPDATEDPSLGRVPHCEECQLRLEDDVPRHMAAQLFGATARAMREYNRRLSSHAVRLTLAHPSKEQLDKFVGLVQVADPSALANVLDDSVVEFLRGFLSRSEPPRR